MQIASITNSQVKASDIPLEQMVGNANVSEESKLKEACRQFEAVLLRQILSEAQKPMLGGDEESSSAVNGIYKDMTTNAMADAISRSGEVGLSSMLEAQLSRQVLNKSGGDAVNNSVKGT
jgi:peptidoglycan hydrolase FlgJ